MESEVVGTVADPGAVAAQVLVSEMLEAVVALADPEAGSLEAAVGAEAS